MKAVFDTNIVMDVVLDRKPFSRPATRLFALSEKGVLQGTLCATTLTTIHSLAGKELGKDRAHSIVGTLISLFEILPVTRAVVESAWLLDWEDFEDGVLHEAARHAGVEILVTRDVKGFSKSMLSVFSPDQLLSMADSLD